MRLNVWAFGLTTGILWGIALPLLALWVMIQGDMGAEIGLLSQTYPGYAATPVGASLGVPWGIADGLPFGLVFAWLYNRLARAMGEDTDARAA
ncbi:MAG: hypothetical protein U9R79_10850 [Armatimonadota bacterium]|nr:hypothetical protein [Armatimonadota bacterium]